MNVGGGGGADRLVVGLNTSTFLGNLVVNTTVDGGGNLTLSNNLTVTQTSTLTGLVTLTTASVNGYSGKPLIRISNKLGYQQFADYGNFRIITGDAGSFFYQPALQSLSGSRTIIGSATAVNSNGVRTTQRFSRGLTTGSYLPAMETANCNLGAVGASIEVIFVDTSNVSDPQQFRMTSVMVNTTTSNPTGFQVLTLERLF